MLSFWMHPTLPSVFGRYRSLINTQKYIVLTQLCADYDPERVEPGVMENTQRLRSAEEVAKVIAFPVSEESGFVTEAVFNVDRD